MLLLHHLVAGFRIRPACRALTAVGLFALVAITLAACDANPSATPAPNNSTMTVAVTPTATIEPEPPDTPTVEGTLDASVTAFEVWQDYMPVVPPDGAPLHGVVTVAITHTEKLTPQILEGTVSLTQAGGNTVAADLPVTLNQQDDDLGMLAPGPQMVTLVFGPGYTNSTLTEGEMLGGTLLLTVGSETVRLALPEVALFFTH